jgi:hypothetical protein
MSQDQYGQARGPGYVVRGDVVPDDESGEFPAEQEGPATRFQKVASALRGSVPERDEQDRTADQAATDEARGDQAAREDPLRRDYWDERTTPDAERDEAVAVTSPDAANQAEDHQATQPDMFGTATHAGNGASAAPAAEGQAGAATIADVPVGGAPVGAPAAQAAQADDEMRPGEAAAALGDFSDLTYGDLIPDAAQYTDQWHQIQYRFVDDPHASVTEAADLIAQVTAKIEAAIQERQRAIEERQRAIAEQQRSLRGRWSEGTNADTEALRATLRMYRTFLDQLIGPRGR